ncbi:expressed unknown protein [Seminavis robusta]|uniref:Uncharacterized protein n=1 Tax=Seminavis robusta TaxID=568900 RepID=A0A9N8EJ39_9STRA|nr:expressed unknown protein [Seminavis robusta]|eukprot:Sro1037_g234210.1 n/a (1434) ;mRNA; r:31390-35859
MDPQGQPSSNSSSVFRMVSNFVSSSRDGSGDNHGGMSFQRVGSNDSEDSNDSISPTPASPPPVNMPLFNSVIEKSNPPFAAVITQPSPPSQPGTETKAPNETSHLLSQTEAETTFLSNQPLVHQPSEPEHKIPLSHMTEALRQNTTPSRRSKRARTPSAKKKESIESERCFVSSRRKQSAKPKYTDTHRVIATKERSEDDSSGVSQNTSTKTTNTIGHADAKRTIESGFKPKKRQAPSPIQTPSPCVELLNVELLATPTHSALRRLREENESSDDLIWKSSAAATPTTYFGDSPLNGATPPPRRNARVRTPFAKGRLSTTNDDDDDDPEPSPWVAVQSATIVGPEVFSIEGRKPEATSNLQGLSDESRMKPNDASVKAGASELSAHQSERKPGATTTSRRRKSFVEPGSLRRSSRRASMSSTYASPSPALFQQSPHLKLDAASCNMDIGLRADSFRGMSPIAASNQFSKPPKPPSDPEKSQRKRRGSRRATLAVVVGDVRQSPALSVDLDMIEKQKMAHNRSGGVRPIATKESSSGSLNTSSSRLAHDEKQSKSSSTGRPTAKAGASPSDSVQSSSNLTKESRKRRNTRRATLSVLVPGQSPCASTGSTITTIDPEEEKPAKRSRTARRQSLSSSSSARSTSSREKATTQEYSSVSQGQSSTSCIAFDDTDDEKPKKRRKSGRVSTSSLPIKASSESPRTTASDDQITPSETAAKKNALSLSSAPAKSRNTTESKPSRRLSTFKLPPLPSATLSSANRKSRRTSLATGSQVVFESADSSPSTQRDKLVQKETAIATRRSPRRRLSRLSSGASLVAALDAQRSQDSSSNDTNGSASGSQVLNPIDMNKSSKTLTPSKRRRSPRKQRPTSNTISSSNTKASYGMGSRVNRPSSSKKRLLGSAEKPRTGMYGSAKRLEKDLQTATIIPAKTISTKASRMFANTNIAREACVSARIFACFDLSQSNVSVAIADIPARQAQSEMVAPLMQLLSCLVRLEMATLGEADGKSSHSRNVHFSGFDCSSVKPPVDSLTGSHEHQDECIVLLVLVSMKIQSIADGRLVEGEKLYDHSTIDVSICSLIRFLNQMLADANLKKECAMSIDATYPPERLNKALVFYKSEFECILKRLTASSSEPSLASKTFLERRLAEIAGQSIRFHLRKLFNPPPLPLTKQTSDNAANDNSLVGANEASASKRFSRVFELVEMTLPNSARDSAVADGSVSSLFSLALSVIFEFFGKAAFLSAKSDADTIPFLSSFCTSPVSQRGLGNPKNPVKYMSSEDLKELIGEVGEVFDFLAVFNACKFLVDLIHVPGVAQEVEQMGGWKPIEKHAKALSDLNLSTVCLEDSHFSAIAHSGNMKHFFAKVENWLSHMEPKVALAEISIKQLAKRYKTRATSPKQRIAIYRKFPHVKVIAEAIEEGRARANAFPLVKEVASSL